MGFIEELKKQMEEESREKANKERRVESASSVAENINKEAVEQYARSIEFMVKSEFPRLVKELKDIVPKMYIDSSSSHYSSKNGIAQIDMQWDCKGLDHNNSGYLVVSCKRVEISFFSDGKIKVKGSLFNSTDLPLEKWNGNSEIQENALGKAFKHPMNYTYHQPDSHASY